MASINQSLKAGEGRVMALNAAARSRLSEEERGGADKRTPWCSERERGRESADRWALLHSERGKGEGARAVSTELAAALGRVRAVGGGGELGCQRPKARGECGVCWARVLGLGQNR